MILAALIFFVSYLDLLSLFLLIFALVFPVVMFIQSRILKRHVSAVINTNAIATGKGDEIKIIVDIKNDNKIPVICARIKACCFNSLDEGEKQYVNISVPLQAGKTHAVSFTVSSQYCGKLRVCLEELRVFDYIKLFSAKVKCGSVAETIILPQAKSINAVCSAASRTLMDFGRFSKTKPGDDPSEIFQIREFADGDRMNRIHWKLSSKSEELIVKDYSAPVNCAVLLLVDFPSVKNGGMVLVDTIIELLLSLSEIMLFNTQPFHVAWYSPEQKGILVTIIENEDDFASFLSVLFDEGVYPSKDAAITAFSDSQHDKRYSHIIYVSSDVTQENTDLLRYNCNSDEKTLVYVSEKSTESAQAILKALNFDLPYAIVPSGHIEQFDGEIII